MGVGAGNNREVVVAPISGVVRDLAQVPDPVFAQEMVGPGLAIEPDGQHTMQVLAPVTGVLLKAHPHAVAVAVPAAGEGAGVLVHLGLDTVGLNGAGFTLHTGAGAQVHRGAHLIDWDPAPALAAGLDLISPVIVLGATSGQLTVLARPGASVRAGQALLSWTAPAQA
ncbi:PTS sugar transporter subunit IIA [Sanguibacter sp. Z1732]|uniref:PTS sugar transporter subunit IIA n=1 Tax=Sanguibacter sp. Z1732 TaxID=3435412 RepID=UPI003D9C9BA3